MKLLVFEQPLKPLEHVLLAFEPHRQKIANNPQ